MRVCYYNWVDYDDKNKRGGGVTVYQKNLIQSISDMQDVTAFYIYSGVSFNVLKKETYFVKKEKKYEVINSGVVAPSHLSFSSDAQVSHPATESVIIDIIRDIGGLDVLHLNNLEGIPVNCLYSIRKEFPDLKIIFSVHNYYPFCPQVNLWEREKRNCKDYNEGRKCITCVNLPNGVGYFKKTYFLESSLQKLKIKDGSLVARKITSIAHKLNNNYYKFIDKPSHPVLTNFSLSREHFSLRRAAFVNAINENCNVVLTVSQRVAELCYGFGIREDLLEVSYIGTAHYNKFISTPAKDGDVKTIAYLGYMRKDKGFEFFIDTLEKVPAELAKKINVVVAARRHNEYYYYKFKELTAKFNNIYFSDGYTHGNIDSILQEVDLGIVPVLWEDNLPQVAIEMHCRKIPILTSNLGGACELHGKNPLFTFNAGSHRDFISKLSELVNNGYDSESYWEKSIPPVEMKQHINSMLEIYKREQGIIHLERA